MTRKWKKCRTVGVQTVDYNDSKTNLQVNINETFQVYKLYEPEESASSKTREQSIDIERVVASKYGPSANCTRALSITK